MMIRLCELGMSGQIFCASVHKCLLYDKGGKVCLQDLVCSYVTRATWSLGDCMLTFHNSHIQVFCSLSCQVYCYS